MGWINRAKAKARLCLWYIEQDGRGCIPTSQHCYCCVPYLMDLRAGVMAIAVFQVFFGVVCFFAVQVLLNPESTAFPQPEIRSINTRVTNILVSLVDHLLETGLHYFDLVFGCLTSAAGVLGVILLRDKEGIFSYTDRGMLKVGKHARHLIPYVPACYLPLQPWTCLSLRKRLVVGVYTRATLFLGGMAALRFTLWALFVMTRPRIYNIDWWYISPVTFFALYHAYVVWCFHTKLKRQYSGDFVGPPVMQGQVPPGLVVDTAHFQPMQLIIPADVKSRADDPHAAPLPQILITMPEEGATNPLNLLPAVDFEASGREDTAGRVRRQG